MTQEEITEIKKFVDDNKFITTVTDGWSRYCSEDVIRVENLMKKLKNIMRRKTNQ